MKIVFIYRHPRPGAFSVENLFNTIATALRAQGEIVIEYEMRPRSRILADILVLRQLQADIYHITGDVNYAALLLPKSRTVLTIHDIGHYLFGLKGWRRWLYKWLWFVLPVRCVAVVTAVSEATRQHLVGYLGVAERRVKAIDNCYASLFRPTHKPYDARCPRILQVGTKPYKNVPRLIEALDGLPCHLVLVGALDTEILAALNRAAVPYENLVALSQDDLLRQYREADLVTFVSVGEGFGLPIIEAQVMGKPLITSNVEPMSSVAGDGACVVDPTSVQSIRAGLKRLLQDQAYRQMVAAAGLKNAERYSPEAIAAKYGQLYRQVHGR
jgi:glycosyltransferase involved in cell wall biosynthesis